mgnify:FL=1
MRIEDDQSLELVGHTALLKDRQVELEVDLKVGRYIAIPRTTGVLMMKPSEWEHKPSTQLLDNKKNISKTFESIIEDIYRKFDLFIGNDLNYEEFKVFYQCISDKHLT